VLRIERLRVGRKTIPGFVSGEMGNRSGEELASIIVLLERLAMTTHFSSSNATRHTASAGAVSSLTNCPVFRSQTLTLPSLPPLTTRVSSNCKLVTLLSCAARRCIGAIFSKDQTRTEPSEPPVTKVLPRICNWPTNEVCPCRIA
jgi:hypothetical protein